MLCAGATEHLLKHLKKSFIRRTMVETIRSVTERCDICWRNNPINMQNSTAEGQAPGEYWQIDFTGLPRKGGLKYLLVKFVRCGLQLPQASQECPRNACVVFFWGACVCLHVSSPG